MEFLEFCGFLGGVLQTGEVIEFDTFSVEYEGILQKGPFAGLNQKVIQ